MARTAESLQNVWQAKFQEHTLNPFTSDPKLGLRYQRYDNPASWWHNPVNPDSLRLTRPAFNMLNKNKEIKRPDNWGGFSIKIAYWEFWQGRDNRTHDRFSYSLLDNKWKIERLSP